MREAGEKGRESPVCAASAPSAPLASPLTLGLCPFSHPCSEEAKSTTWLHPVTGEAVVTGHRRQSTGNPEPGRAPSELGSAGRRRQITGHPPPGNLPRAAVLGRRRGEAGATGVLSSLWTPLFSAAFHHHLETAPSSCALSPSQRGQPSRPYGGRLPSPWNPEFYLPQPLLNLTTLPHPFPIPCPPVSMFRETFPTPLPSLQPGTLPLVRREKIFTSSPSSRESCLLPCSFLLLLGGICG